MKSAVETDAVEAAAAAGVEVRQLVSVEEQQIARHIFDETWPGEGTQITPNLMQALSHNGAYVSAAFDANGRAIGAAFAFPGVDESGLHLHSHMAAVLPNIQNSNVGRALKFHQRAWAVQRGYHAIRWTFDPLVRRNAYLNIRKLGVDVIAYYENFYGEMPDAVNAGDYSDRLMVQWNLESEKASLAARGTLPAIDPSRGVVVELPEDIVAIRTQDKEKALAFRLNVRQALQSRFAEGWLITGLTEEGNYVLERS